MNSFIVRNIVKTGGITMARRGENIYKRKDGRWEGRYKCGVKPDGTAKYLSVYGKSYTEVKTALIEKHKKSIVVDTPKNLTVKNLFDIWFAEIRLKVKESTYMNYHMKYDKHVSGTLGGLLYDKLTAEILNEFIQIKLSSGLSLKYTADIAALIKSVFRFAKKRFSYEDKAELISLPKVRIKEKELLHKSEQTLLNTYLTSNPTSSNVGILLSSATGIRIGELCALKWENIDLENGVLTIKNTVQRIANINGDTATRLVVTPPKSSSSVREIPIPEFLLPILRNQKENKDCYLLSGSRAIVEPRTMQYRFKRILKELKLSEVSFHSLRHQFATNCIALGFDVKSLSEILGHSTVEITLNRYVHSSMERKTEFMNILSKQFTIIQ